jgi:ATP-dependent DNA helicase RecQ
VDRNLFDRLRALRLTIARDRGVPPYVILHDTTLRDLARRKPTTVAALHDIYGIGERKAEDLGEVLVGTIRASLGV